MVLSNAQWFNKTGAYEIDNSCRFNDDDTASLQWATTATATNTDIGTISVWLKRGNLGITNTRVWNKGNSATPMLELIFMNTDKLMINGDLLQSISTQTFRDPSAWYNIVVAVDTSQGVAANRIKIYVNGTQITAWDAESWPDQNDDIFIGTDWWMGRWSNPVTNYNWDGYLAEVVYTDGTAYGPSDFGETNSTTGQWVPKDVSGLTFGNMGFWLDFADSSALGNDISGNDNDFTSINLAAADQVTDSPTDNYCTLNPLTGNSGITYSNGNLDVSYDSTYRTFFGSQALPATGKWYWEVKAIGGTAPISGSANWDNVVGVGTSVADDSPTGESTNWLWGNARTTAGGSKYNGSSTTLVPAASLEDNGIVQIAVDMDNSKIWWGVNNSWMGTASGDNDGDPAAGSNAAFDNLSGELFPLGNTSYDYSNHNFGQLGFAYTPPTGFEALSTANLDDPTIADPSGSFQSTIYTGDGASSLAVNQGGNSTFEPDFVWLKNRDAADNHCVFDSVRGATNVIFTNNADVQTTDADTLTSFDSDGFSLGDDDKVNTNTEKYVGWQWLESNTPALDIVQYEGTGSKQTISHGLGVAPDLIIFKNIDSAQGWAVYHRPLGPEYEIRLSTATAAIDDAAFYDDDNPTSSVFTVNTNSAVNGSGNTHIAYVFAEVEGFSKVGKYTGNGDADGPFVWCGFRPEMVIIKNASSAENWAIHDTQRSPYNVVVARLEPSANDAEATNLTVLDFLSNGFKIRGTDGMWNSDGDTYIFAAFAETPFKTANAR